MTYDTQNPSPHFQDHQPVHTGGGDTYAALPAGPGRWVALEAPLGVLVGTLWTDDDQGLGFAPVDAEQNPGAPAFTADLRAGLLHAHAAGAPASVVFDAWAGRASQGVAARQVESGDLARFQA